jgi:hypothetical protein
LYLDPPAHAIVVCVDEQSQIQAWLAAHPRVRRHCTPTYGSWRNLVEVFFAIIDRQALRRGDLTDVDDLMAAIRRFCDGWNQRCQPFTWTKDADQILTKLRRSPTSATDHWRSAMLSWIACH